jgi:hypothetical protein
LIFRLTVIYEARDAKRMDAFIQYGMGRGLSGYAGLSLEITDKIRIGLAVEVGAAAWRYWAHRKNVSDPE